MQEYHLVQIYSPPERDLNYFGSYVSEQVVSDTENNEEIYQLHRLVSIILKIRAFSPQPKNE
jgi:hypothetical protein